MTRKPAQRDTRPLATQPQTPLRSLPRRELGRVRGGIRTGSGVIIELDDDC